MRCTSAGQEDTPLFDAVIGLNLGEHLLEKLEIAGALGGSFPAAVGVRRLAQRLHVDEHSFFAHDVLKAGAVVFLTIFVVTGAAVKGKTERIRPGCVVRFGKRNDVQPNLGANREPSLTDRTGRLATTA